MRLFHYTDAKGYKGIQREGKIRVSNGAYGQAVYLTDLDPKKHKQVDIGNALFLGGGPEKVAAGRLYHYIALDGISSNEVKLKREHVFCYYRGDLLLRNYAVVSEGFELLAAAAVAVAGQKCWDAALSGRERRQQELRDRLRKTLQLLTSGNQIPEHRYEVKDASDMGIHIRCKECSAEVSQKFYGGMIYASKLDSQAVMKTVVEHEYTRHCPWWILMAGVAVIAGVCIAFVRRQL